MMYAKLLISEINRRLGFDITIRTRKRKFVYGRTIAFKILRDKGFCFTEIGAAFDLDHATVIHGLNKFKEICIYDDFKKMLEICNYPKIIFIPKNNSNLNNGFCNEMVYNPFFGQKNINI